MKVAHLTRWTLVLASSLCFSVAGAQTPSPRADIVLLYDTSGSMASAGDPWGGSQCTDCGSDCLADRSGDVDICGDGMCTGVEAFGGCGDCTLEWNDDPETSGVSPAGQAPECGMDSRSFLAMSKQLLRTLLPEIRDVARFALLTQNQTGYYRYYEGTDAEPAKKVSIFLTEWELKNLGAWDVANSKPQPSFGWPGSGTSFALVSDGTVGLGVAADALYYRDDAVDVEKRFAYAGATLTDAGKLWRYSGSYYTYLQQAIKPASERVEASYRGPQFEDGGKTWVYGRWRFARCSSKQQGFGASCAGAPLMLVPFDASPDQAVQDVVLGKVLAFANKAANGGMFANGPTPLGPALEVAKQHYIDRINGTGPFAAYGPDPYASCRKRIIILITDTTLSCTNSTETELAKHAKDLYDFVPQNPILTNVISLPGGDLTKVDDIALAGGTAALQVTDQKTLIATFKAVLDTAVGSDVIGGLTCSPSPCVNGKCAVGWSCLNGFCVQPSPDGGVSLDAGVSDGGASDGGAVDGAVADGAVVDGAVVDGPTPTDGGGGTDSTLTFDGPSGVDGPLAADGPLVFDSATNDGAQSLDGPLALDGAQTVDGSVAVDGAASVDGAPGDSSSATDGAGLADGGRSDAGPADAAKADGGPGGASTGGASTGGGGCDCHVASGQGEGPMSLGLTLLLFLLVRRRR